MSKIYLQNLQKRVFSSGSASALIGRFSRSPRHLLSGLDAQAAGARAARALERAGATLRAKSEAAARGVKPLGKMVLGWKTRDQ